MSKTKYIDRVIEKDIGICMKIHGVVHIEGVRYCGKTTTCDRYAVRRVDLKDGMDRNLIRKKAIVRPREVLDGEKPCLLDEFTECMEPIRHLRFVVEETNDPGQYLIVNSRRPDDWPPHKLNYVTSSYLMRPMSTYERDDHYDTEYVSVRDLFENEFGYGVAEPTTLEDVARWLVMGGWPADIQDDEPGRTPSRLLKELTCCDQRRMDVIRTLARNEFRINSSGHALELFNYEHPDDPMTICEMEWYIKGLKDEYVIETLGIRAEKWEDKTRADRIQMVDPSISVAALGMNEGSLLRNRGMMEGMFKSMVLRDLRVYGLQYPDTYLFEDGSSIDLITGRDFGIQGYFDIVLDESGIEDSATRMRRLYAKAYNKPLFMAVIVGACEGSAYRRKDGVLVIPVTTLKP